MADEADRADIEIDSLMAENRYRLLRQQRMAPALRPIGRCHFCDEAVPELHLFCDLACSEDHQAEEEALKRAGRWE